MKKRPIALLGKSLLLEILGDSLRRFPENKVLGFPAVESEINRIADLKPEVIIFDLDSPRPQTVFSLLESEPEVVLIGVSSDSNLVKIWTGRQLSEMSIQDLLKVIHEQVRKPPGYSIRAGEIHQVTRNSKKEKEANIRRKRR
jgi:hypothetical protein